MVQLKSNLYSDITEYLIWHLFIKKTIYMIPIREIVPFPKKQFTVWFFITQPCEMEAQGNLSQENGMKVLENRDHK